MVKEWVDTERRYKRAGINKMLAILRREHQTFFNEVLRRGAAANRKAAKPTRPRFDRTKAPQTVTVEPVGNLDAWAKVINEEAAKLDLALVAQATPVYENVASGVYEQLSVKLGAQPPKHEIFKQQHQGKLLAQKVTGITHTTKLKMHKVIRDGIEEELTVAEMVKRLKEKFPNIASNRFPTIARTEMGNAADAGTKAALKQSKTVLEVSVIGCEAVEPGIPTYKGKPTCNIQGVPKEDVDKLEFHINHTGAIVPSKFMDDKDVPNPLPDQFKDDPEPKPKPKPPQPNPVQAVIAPEPPPTPVEEVTGIAALLLKAKRRLRAFRKDREPRQRVNGAGEVVDMKDPRKALGQFRKLEGMETEEWKALMEQIKNADQLDWADDIELSASRFFNTNIDVVDFDLVDKTLDSLANLDGIDLPPMVIVVKNAKGQYTVVSGHEQAVAMNLLGRPIKARVFDPKKNPIKPDPKPDPIDVQPPAVAAKPLVDSGEFPQGLDNLEEVRSLGGSTGAKLVRDRDSGKLFVMKKGADGPHLEEEMLADSLYRAAGVNVPEFRRYLDSGGRPVKLAEFIDGDSLSDLPSAKQRAAFKQMQEDFGLDAFMGNWDVGGTGLDNVIVDSSGKVWRIDNGGSLRFRAQGARKTDDQFNPFSEDLWTMREQGNIANTIFGDMDWDAIERSLTKIDFDKILDAIPDKELRELMQERALQYRRTARMARNYRNGEYLSSYRDTQLRMGMKLRKNGMSEGAPTEMQVQNGTQFYDPDKGLWGGLRGTSANQTTPAAGTGMLDDPDDIFPQALAAVKTLKHHALKPDGPDFDHNNDTLNAFQSKFEDAPPHIKKHYAEVEEWVNKATLASLNQDADFFKTKDINVEKLPPKKPTKPKSDKTAMEALQDTAREIFGSKYDNAGNAVEAWKASQASDSWYPESMSHSFFQMKQTGLKDKDVFLKGNTYAGLESDYKQMASDYGLTVEELDTAMGLQHQWTQEVLEHARFTGNDWERGVVLLRRSCPTEEFGVSRWSDLKVGEFYEARPGQRGPNMSSSIAQSYTLNGDSVAEQAVPHSRITGLYWAGRSWNHPNTRGFAGEHENEFTFFAPGIPMAYRGEYRDVRDTLNSNYATGKYGTDATKWNVPLDHIKKFLARLLRKLYVRRDCSCQKSH